VRPGAKAFKTEAIQIFTAANGVRVKAILTEIALILTEIVLILTGIALILTKTGPILI
jgi:hypothetical protein